MENPALSAPDSVPDSIERRNAIRRACLTAREALPADEHARLSARIDEQLTLFLGHRSPMALAFCWPFRSEFDARPLVTRLIDMGWRAALPVVGETVGPMTFREWTPAAAMHTDRHGIATPVAGEELQPKVLLLPFNAIDLAGYRLGYGAGYFDRTLAGLKPSPYVIGVGFELAVVDSVYPQAHDIPVNCRVTETGVYPLR